MFTLPQSFSPPPPLYLSPYTCFSTASVIHRILFHVEKRLVYNSSSSQPSTDTTMGSTPLEITHSGITCRVRRPNAYIPLENIVETNNTSNVVIFSANVKIGTLNVSKATYVHILHESLRAEKRIDIEWASTASQPCLGIVTRTPSGGADVGTIMFAAALPSGESDRRTATTADMPPQVGTNRKLTALTRRTYLHTDDTRAH